MSPERGGVLLCIFGGFSWQTVYTYAMAAPVFLSLYLLAPKSQKALRHFSMVIFVVLAASIILGGYLRGVMALALGVAVVLQTTTGLVKKRYIRWAVGCTIAFLILFLLMKYTPGGRQAMDRIMRYDEDGSIAVRTGLYGPALAAFFENPLFGWGLYYDEQYQTPNGAFMDGHAGILYIAASLGVVFLLPLILLLWKLWAALSALSSPRLTPIEKALITGFKGVFIVYIAEVIIEGSVFGNIPCDFILWTVAGLVTVWGYWSKRGQYDKFIA
jgi:O-antigen ligase